MTRLTPREMRLVLLAGILYAAIAIPVGIRRGGDLEAHFTAARLWVEGLPLYARPPRVGVWLPPLAVLLVVPFALAAQLSAVAAGLSFAPLLRYGAIGAYDAVRDWLQNSAPVAWTQGGSNQSLSTLATRLHLPRVGLAVLDLACVALGVVALRRPKVSDAAFE